MLSKFIVGVQHQKKIIGMGCSGIMAPEESAPTPQTTNKPRKSKFWIQIQAGDTILLFEKRNSQWILQVVV